MPLNWGWGNTRHLSALFSVAPPDDILYGHRLLTFFITISTG
ncbi:hypothetical protein ACVK1X_003135 [Pseudomonas sp. PvR086]